KLMVSTMASGDVSPYVGTSDICLLHSVTDIAGLNRISRAVLANAAHAAAGMALHRPGPVEDQAPLVAITMFGVTTPCVLRVPWHNPTVTAMRTTVGEGRGLGRIFAAKVGAARGPTVVLLPLRGLSAFGAPGQPFEDAEADAALFAAVRAGLREGIALREIDA